jgi:signal transduction histidine kinase
MIIKILNTSRPFGEWDTKLKNKNVKSLRTEFLGFFIISIVAAIIFGLLSFYIVEKNYYKAKIDSYNIEKEKASQFIEQIHKKLSNLNNLNQITEEMLKPIEQELFYHINIVNENGEVIYESGHDTVLQRDFVLYRTFSIMGDSYIIFLEGQYRENTYEENVLVMMIIALSVLLFIFIFFRLANKRINYIHEISESVDRISNGDLNTPIALSGNDELTSLAQNINYMSLSIKERNAYEDRIEKSKKELITNMSHDLRTPLTSIIGYLNLIREERYEDNHQLKEYVEICFSKAQQLKQLINRLFEYSKLTSEAINIEQIQLDINRFIAQLKGEYSHLVEDNQLTFSIDLCSGKPLIYADPLFMVRVFENLIHNAVKYAKKPGKLIIKSWNEKENVIITFSNTVDHNLFSIGDMANIFDRMFIKDKSRQEGKSSGLGLAICREIVELNGGKIWATLEENYIVFWISFKRISN